MARALEAKPTTSPSTPTAALISRLAKLQHRRQHAVTHRLGMRIRIAFRMMRTGLLQRCDSLLELADRAADALEHFRARPRIRAGRLGRAHRLRHFALIANRR